MYIHSKNERINSFKQLYLLYAFFDSNVTLRNSTSILGVYIQTADTTVHATKGFLELYMYELIYFMRVSLTNRALNITNTVNCSNMCVKIHANHNCTGFNNENFNPQ